LASSSSSLLASPAGAPPPELVDCSCASQYEEGRELIWTLHFLRQFECAVDGAALPRNPTELRSWLEQRSERQGGGGEGRRRVGVAVTDHTGNVASASSPFGEDLSSQYANLKRFKYALSPSSRFFQSPCEWEAIAVGAIPIVHSFWSHSIDGEVLSGPFTSITQALYRNLPMLVVQSWSAKEISSVQLKSNYYGLKSTLTKPPHSIEKLFLPYWLKQFSRYLLTAKPSNRMFTPHHSELKKIAKPPTCDSTLSIPDYASQFSFIANSDPHATAPSVKAEVSRGLSPITLELVVPRCCEDAAEFSWLPELLKAFAGSIHASIYYKCPMCLPASRASEWIHGIINRHAGLMSRIRNGYRLLSEDFNSSQVTQRPCFDTVYNGKEVTAYLQHITSRYHSLANQTIFLHSLPQAHINFETFYSTLLYNQHCNQALHFMHLNVNYKTGGLWGKCCGKSSSCQHSTWKWLFEDQFPSPASFTHAFISGHFNAGTYSSAQFAASSDAIRRRPLLFWNKMMMAINGSHDLNGCDDGRAEGPWGGHRLTGQYERMWHVIFGFQPMQVFRINDESLPNYFRKSDFASERSEGAL
jgi:hypothetical protein